MSGRLAWIAASIAGVAACAPLPTHQIAAPPDNDCAAYPCASYASSPGVAAATCVAGACLTPSPAPGDLVLTVAIPEGALSAPGRTFAGFLSDVLKARRALPSCTEDLCFRLPIGVQVGGAYTVLPSDIATVQSSLFSTPASLPSQATYRPLWPPDASVPSSDAFGAGLPLVSVQANTVAASTIPSSALLVALNGVSPRPGGGSPVGFQANLVAGASYTRIISPDSPFDEDFPPDVHVVDEEGPSSIERVALVVDKTNVAAPIPNYPSFALSRADGPLDGWTAYLRDSSTKILLSPIKRLQGMSTPDGGVLLATNHVTGKGDALVGTELVMAPPVSQALPAEVFSYPAIASGQETYAVLPKVASIAGGVRWADGHPPAATVIFEAANIYAVQPGTGDSDAGSSASAPPVFPAQPNFEYTTRVTARPGGAGDSAYAVASLPRGIYRVVVRPDDPIGQGSPTIVHGNVIECFDTTDGTAQDADAGTPGPSITVNAAPVVQGIATIADGRPLVGATVYAIATGCAPSTGSCSALSDSPNCMPRSAQATTDSEGTFSLALDPGSYRVSVDPGAGSRLPIVSQSVSVPASAPLAFRVSAPTHLHLQLTDALGPFIADAVVRLYAFPDQGPAAEVGRAITDTSGRFDMYLDPSLQ